MLHKKDEMMQRQHKELIEHYIMPSCLNCHNFNEKDALCVKYDSRPPPRVIVFACPAYEIDIPF